MSILGSNILVPYNINLFCYKSSFLTYISVKNGHYSNANARLVSITTKLEIKEIQSIAFTSEELSKVVKTVASLPNERSAE